MVSLSGPLLPHSSSDSEKHPNPPKKTSTFFNFFINKKKQSADRQHRRQLDRHRRLLVRRVLRVRILQLLRRQRVRRRRVRVLHVLERIPGKRREKGKKREGKRCGL